MERAGEVGKQARAQLLGPPVSTPLILNGRPFRWCGSQPGGGLNGELAPGLCPQGGHTECSAVPAAGAPETKLLTQGGQKAVHHGKEAEWLSPVSSLCSAPCLSLTSPHVQSPFVM